MTDEQILKAFEEGAKACRMDKDRVTNPYMPSSEAELYAAWNAGWDEEDPCYTAMHQ